MDCERFEANLIDELYEELDELTSAAAKRHVAGCARCASLIGGLRATRRVAVLPIVEPSLDLEDRILAAARNAQKVVPIGRRLSRAISMAGSWAMRPQTAMAAVFVLMIGSSLLFVRRGRVASNDSVRVTAEGEPAALAGNAKTEDESNAPVDSKVAAAAHGAPRPAYAPPPAAAASAVAGPVATTAPNDSPLAYKERAALPKGAYDNESNGFGDSRRASNASAPAGAPPATPSPIADALKQKDDAPIPSDLDKVAQGPQVAQNMWAGGKTSGGGSASTGASQGQAPSPTSQQGPGADGDLKAANATRDTNGCGAATDTYDRIAKQSWGTKSGYDAEWAAAECYRALGKNDLAQARYTQLLTVTQYATLAQGRIALMSQNQGQVAARAVKKAAPAAPPPAKPAAPGRSSVQQQQAPTQSTPAAQQQQQGAF